MVDFSHFSTGDWLGVYGAGLSTSLALIGIGRYVTRKWCAKRERAKFKTDLYLLRKIDKTTRKVHPIVTILLANLGTERLSLKSLEYEGVVDEMKTTQQHPATPIALDT